MTEAKPFREKVLKKQKTLIRVGLKKHRSLRNMGKVIGIPYQQLARYHNGEVEMRWSTYLQIKEMLNA